MKNTLNTNKGIGLNDKSSNQKLYSLKYNKSLKFDISKQDKHKSKQKLLVKKYDSLKNKEYKKKCKESKKVDSLKIAKDALNKKIKNKINYNKRKFERAENFEISKKQKITADNNNNNNNLISNNNIKKKKLNSLVLKWDFDNPCKK